MTFPIYQVDAFTNQRFAGNPAAVVVMEEAQLGMMEVSMMQAIAAENNLSETAFLVPEGAGWQLRWFTPSVEVDLCGHATLACAHILFTEGYSSASRLEFYTASGTLVVSREGDGYCLDFPAKLGEPATLPAALAERLGFEPEACLNTGRQWLVVTSEANVRGFAHHFSDQPGDGGIILTAQGSGEFDVVSRYFGFAGLGIEEDPVTGSAHCLLIPYWAKRLAKNSLKAYQASKRGGVLHCCVEGARVTMAGDAVTYMKGSLYLA
ncbi:PhzF family phenazine biosynthesis protein [Halioxenophilus sp. WMMB6]|uniref:PhzF family phenazine biosynthesis protein n=1 Tax=Halioxenophilus sp. WMMB6 TaxID=3073815 RepID=UPI00295E32E1|nr:PhzF family phenazine biosynthesis protein [Halioxenophilus sp. WMMB6]